MAYRQATAISILLISATFLVQASHSKLTETEADRNPPRWPWTRSNAQREMLGSLRAGQNQEDPTEPFRSPTMEDSKAKWPWTESKMMSTKDPGKDEHGRVQMGVSSENCDNAKTNLTLDWDLSPANYTCFHPETRFPLDPPKPPLQECTTLPESYRPGHVCMDQHVMYDEDIPSYGDHRPLWPIFGEYLFVPRERWLHNIEHGAIVMLYHPCAHPMEVSQLREIVRGCVGKHVITPSTLVPPDRPLALVAWGCRLLLSVVDPTLVRQFIRDRAMKGPEGTYTKEGQYDFGLIRPANATTTSRYDRVTCDGNGL